MSYGVQSASLFGSSSQSDSASNSLRPFANLDLTEDQRSQIRSIFKNAKSEGLSQSQIEQQILAVLTPTQQTTLQSDLASTAASSSTDSSSGADSTTGANQAPPPPPGGDPFTDPNGPFGNLNLTSAQQSQISQIFQNAQSQGLTFDQVNAQINAILTPTQQTAFAADLQNLPPPPGSQSASPSQSNPLDNLGLSDDQKSQIDTILQNAQSDGLSPQDVLSQIETVLSPAQQSAFLQDVQTAQAIVSGQSQTGSGGTTATLSNGLTEANIKNQIAAATSLILQQFQSEVASTTA